MIERSEAEAKLIEYCEELDIEAGVNWQEQPVSLRMRQWAEANLFQPDADEAPVGEAVLSIRGGKIVCDFGSFRIGMVELTKISKLFAAAYMRYLEDFYICNSVREGIDNL